MYNSLNRFFHGAKVLTAIDAEDTIELNFGADPEALLSSPPSPRINSQQNISGVTPLITLLVKLAQ